jgi:membrane-associated phospholipid phosphatase
MRSALRWCSSLIALFALLSIFVMTPSFVTRLDDRIGHRSPPRLKGIANTIIIGLDDIGLRGFSATVLLIAAVLIGLRFRSWRPINLSLLSLLGLNVVVGGLKIAFGREKPRLGHDQLHVVGIGAFPSGHSANAILTWGLLAYLIYHYTHRAIGKGKALGAIVGTATLTVCAVSLYRNTHWLSDLVGGVLIGGAILVFVIAVDRFVPSSKQPVQP